MTKYISKKMCVAFVCVVLKIRATYTLKARILFLNNYTEESARSQRKNRGAVSFATNEFYAQL